MLILVGVTINFAINGGIINKAKEAGKQTQIAADREALLSCVIASMGLDGKVDFEDLDQEILKIGFTGTNGTYTSPSGNVFTVNEDGNITSEGESSGGESSSTDADYAYLQTLVGKPFSEFGDLSGLTFNNPNITTDFLSIQGSLEYNGNIITLPILYKGKSYNVYLDATDGSNPIIDSITENTANNTNQDLVYLRSFIGKHTSEYAVTDPVTGDLTFADSNITFTQDYDGNPISLGDGYVMVPIIYNGNEYSFIVRVISSSDQICFAIMEGIYEPEVATN